MADVNSTLAEHGYIATEQATRNGGAAWSAGLGLIRNHATDAFKVGVNTVDGGRIAGIIPAGFEAQPDLASSSMHQFGRYEVPLVDSTTTAMSSQLACNASGKFRLAVFGDYVCAIALAVASGTGQRCPVQLLPYAAQFAYAGGSDGGGVEILTGATKTLVAADHGKTFIATVVDTVVTLPATIAGLEFTVIAGIASTTTGLSLDPVAADNINGGTDNKDLINTAATDVVGDAATLVGNGTTGYFTKSKIGTWAAEA